MECEIGMEFKEIMYDAIVDMMYTYNFNPIVLCTKGHLHSL